MIIFDIQRDTFIVFNEKFSGFNIVYSYKNQLFYSWSPNNKLKDCYYSFTVKVRQQIINEKVNYIA